MDPLAILKKSGIKVTKSRMAVLTVLQSTDYPLDALKIFDVLKSKKIKIDPATVYRILERLLSVGVVKQVDFREGKLRYELAGDHHPHLVCQVCGDIKPYHGQYIVEMKKEILNNHKFMVKDHTLEFFGICKKCQ